LPDRGFVKGRKKGVHHQKEVCEKREKKNNEPLRKKKKLPGTGLSRTSSQIEEKIKKSPAKKTSIGRFSSRSQIATGKRKKKGLKKSPIRKPKRGKKRCTAAVQKTKIIR